MLIEHWYNPQLIFLQILWCSLNVISNICKIINANVENKIKKENQCERIELGFEIILIISNTCLYKPTVVFFC